MTFALPRRLWRSAATGLLLATLVAAPVYAEDLLTAAPADGIFNPRVPPADVGDGRIHVAQTKQEAQLISRIQDLEEQVRTLTGQIEGLQFQLTQMQQLIDRMTQDNEYRFEQLEGTAGQKPPAKPAANGTGAGNTGNQGELDNPAGGQEPSDQTATAGAASLSPLSDGQTASADQPAGADQPMDNDTAPLDLTLGDSQDPLLKGGSGTLGTLSDSSSLGDATTTAGLSNGDAKAQYQAGYDAITRGDYAFAQDQFSQFIALYPTDPQAPDATNWLGEAMIQQGAYTDAAQVLADGYTKYKDSKRAPDILLKLGIALAAADQRDVACRTFFTLAKRYPNLAPAFRTRLGEENQKAQCPPIS